MDIRFAFIYIAVNAFCFIVAAIIVSKFSLNVGSERDIIIFRRMVYSYMVFLFTEIIWAFGYSGIFNINPTVYGLIKASGTFFIPLMVYFWFTFALNRFHISIDKIGTKLLIALPIILLFIAYISSYFTKIIFVINDQGFVEYGPGYVLGGVVDNVYGVAIIITSCILLIKNKGKIDRSTFIIQIIFIAICTIGGILDAYIVDTPIMQLAICLSFVYLFINIQEPNIYNDSLTGLHNRRRTDIFMRDIIEGNNNDWHLFMMDIDNFKKTNDTKGHVFGDNVIKIVADSIEEAANEYKRGFAARWGGDEFVAIMQDEREDFTKELDDKIENNIKNHLEENNINYPIHISIGHVKFDKDKIKNLKEFIDAADKQLYIDKKNK